MTSDRIGFVTPLPPLPTGIAQYSRDLLRALDGRWPLTVVAERGSRTSEWSVYRASQVGRFDGPRGELPTVFQIGNSGYHRCAYRRALRTSGILVLHDVLLHHGRMGELLRSGGGTAYRDAMRHRYGAVGAAAASRMLSGLPVEEITSFPLSEDYIENAIMTVVHSDYALWLVQRLVPHARVVRVPMGVPLPALVDQQSAREALGIPISAFVVASITHVNPYKRLHVVLKAMRRFVDKFPETLLLVAGSMSPNLNLERMVFGLGLERHVRILGYVDDGTARLLARAADALVNLRHPSAGETSASLLRILGAGRPVLVTDDPSTNEYPRDAVLPVAVDKFEEEMIAELLLMLASDDATRAAAGRAARRFVEREHTLTAMLMGYRSAIRTAFGIELPDLGTLDIHEAAPAMTTPIAPATAFSSVETRMVDELVGLRLDRHNATIERVAQAVIDLRLDRLPAKTIGRPDEQATPNPPGTTRDPRLPSL